MDSNFFKFLLINFIFLVSIDDSSTQNKMIFPRAFAFAIDDLGWNIGDDTGDIDGQGPYRIGLHRKMTLKDYQPIVAVGKEVGVRIQSLFILSEMDRLNILKNYPTTTWQGKAWDNSHNISEKQITIMNYVKDNAAYLEFGLHGVGHEYWVDGKKQRAEWYCTEENHPWAEETMREHIQCFKAIMAQYGLSESKGHSFPESFVPCAYGYYWNPKGKYSTGKIMSEAGVKYVNTLFEEISELNPPKEPNGGGFDNGVIVVNRINYGNEWFQLGALPTLPIAAQKSDIIETHWSNWLAQDYFLQEELNEKFIAYYKKVQQTPDRYVAKNTEQFHSQWLYKKYTLVSEKERETVHIDNTQMPDEAYQNDILGSMLLKIELGINQHIKNATLNKKRLGVYFEEEGYGFLYLPQLQQKEYVLNYQIGEETMSEMLWHNGTYNVYSFNVNKRDVTTEIRVYGTQKIIFKGIKNPKSIIVSNPNIKILKKEYITKEKRFILTVQAKDIQGETATFVLK